LIAAVNLPVVSKALVAGVGAGHLRHHQHFKPDALLVAEVVPLVQLVPAAELAPDRVPHQLHHLDPVLAV
jgi:hypothetical protein